MSMRWFFVKLNCQHSAKLRWNKYFELNFVYRFLYNISLVNLFGLRFLETNFGILRKFSCNNMTREIDSQARKIMLTDFEGIHIKT